ncbi:hypothetical protein E3N88_37756 [Mikania micrantha]|uniref:Uncharacterized protein n=1 Tax=Mikania micrantha TaxID=192012 RepID=A0A5N6LS34_9ASTR|nr:hypothetical protein E3N88_37756 [Mikania micrantha]
MTGDRATTVRVWKATHGDTNLQLYALQDENKNQKEQNTPTLVVAAAVTSPPSRHDNRNTQPREHQPRQNPQHRRDTNRNQPGQRPNNRSTQAQSSYSQARNYGPMPPPYYMAPSAPHRAPSPYWAPPPCPYPTQNWAPTSWTPQSDSRPNNRRSYNSSPAQPNNGLAQVHLADDQFDLGIDSLAIWCCERDYI